MLHRNCESILAFSLVYVVHVVIRSSFHDSHILCMVFVRKRTAKCPNNEEGACTQSRRRTCWPWQEPWNSLPILRNALFRLLMQQAQRLQKKDVRVWTPPLKRPESEGFAHRAGGNIPQYTCGPVAPWGKTWKKPGETAHLSKLSKGRRSQQVSRLRHQPSKNMSHATWLVVGG